MKLNDFLDLKIVLNVLFKYHKQLKQDDFWS